MFEKDSSLLGKLMDYGKSDAYPFHMPGHKRRDLGNFPNPYQIDITEIDGFDNLHHAEGILKESMKKASPKSTDTWFRFLASVLTGGT